MNARAHVYQDHAYTRAYSGEVTAHQPGLELTVEWTPGHAAQARDALTAAYRQLLAQISDEEQA